MKKYKKIIAFCLACMLGVTTPVQSVWAKETSVTASGEKSESSAQEKKEAYIVSELSVLKEAAALLEKQYEAEMQCSETIFLKYLVQHVYSYIERANQILTYYKEQVKTNPVNIQKEEPLHAVCLLVLEEKNALEEQIKAFNVLQLLQNETVQQALVTVETALSAFSAEQILTKTRELSLKELQYINLPVTLHVQETTYTCGMASSKMILDYLQIKDKKGKLYKESTLWNWSDSNGQGTYVYRVAQTLTKFGVNYEYKHMAMKGKDKTEYYDQLIRASLEKNRPVIAQVRPDKNEYWEYSSGHYILVKGMFVDKEGISQVIINDCHYKYSAQDKIVPLTELIHSVEKHSSYMIFGK